MKRFLLAISIIISFTSITSGYSGGTGEPNDPYQIADVNDLLELASDDPNYDKCFILTADINLAGNTFTTAVIAHDRNGAIIDFQGTAFSGVFKGNEHKIMNLTIDTNGAGNDYLGLFGYINYSSEVNNIILENARISTGDSSNIGGLIGFNDTGTISDCNVTGTIIGNSNSNCIGGLTGYNRGGIITNCCSTVIIEGAIYSRTIGGLTGYNDGGIITYCFSSINISHAGGYTSGPVGGLVGDNQGIISDCNSSGTINTSIYENFSSTGTGGLVGGNGIDCFIINCHSSINLAGYSGGGLVGNNSGTINYCFSTGVITGESGTYYLGGLVGHNTYYGNISRCYSTITVSSPYSFWSGGFVGYNVGDINQCFSTGNISMGTDSYDIGGLVGFNNWGNIKNCFSTSDVNCGINSYHLGGLIGETNHGDINSCYSSGIVNGDYEIGGMLGYNYLGTIASCYFLETSGPDNGLGVPLADANMKQQESFVGWDFVNETINGTEDIWTIKEDVNYPVLVWPLVNLKWSKFPFGWYEVDFCDFAVMGNWWGRIDCADNNDCGGADFDFSGKMDFFDLDIFCKYWLDGTID